MATKRAKDMRGKTIKANDEVCYPQRNELKICPVVSVEEGAIRILSSDGKIRRLTRLDRVLVV